MEKVFDWICSMSGIPGLSIMDRLLSRIMYLNTISVPAARRINVSKKMIKALRAHLIRDVLAEQSATETVMLESPLSTGLCLANGYAHTPCHKKSCGCRSVRTSIFPSVQPIKKFTIHDKKIPDIAADLPMEVSASRCGDSKMRLCMDGRDRARKGEAFFGKMKNVSIPAVAELRREGTGAICLEKMATA